ncbi:unnamed protein product [Allacma fusca]|uniref:RNA-directed DNA polymerase n=1 Tax=Allacma fusca TaxID=39272 RepID=A0A8J2P5V1_9HEXA|nr:unnamed protein product [Allacma fusca]
MRCDGIIEDVTEPSEWCAPLVLVKKANGDIRPCVDLTRLNTQVKRKTHPMPAVDYLIAQVPPDIFQYVIFTKLDAKSGFWQKKLAEKSRHLTTFITPFGSNSILSTKRSELHLQKGLILRNSRIVIPGPLRDEVLHKLHTGHFGIKKCHRIARETVWWPRITAHIEEMVRKCQVYIQHNVQLQEPLIPSEFPTHAWETVAMDLFYLHGKWYLLIADYYSRYPEFTQLESLTSKSVILKCKEIFARHGIPTIVRSDNGPQFEPISTSDFEIFAREWDLDITSSPKFPQSNGLIEKMVNIIKLAMKKNSDPT